MVAIPYHSLDLLFFIAAGQPLPSSLTALAPHHYHPRRCPFLASSSAPVAGRRLRLFSATIFLFLLYPTTPSCIFLLNLYRCPAAPASSSAIVVATPSTACSPYCRYLAALHLLGAPHDAAASSPAVAALTTTASSNHAPYCCTSLLPPLPLLAAPCSSPGCRSNCCPSLSLPPLATTAAPTISN
ncbi:hypothetical protein B296_00007231 [Ensete ventricosum]|uniref:Uncharacterized protein n=1 Tax=Ensete ventricosum TaxID=4639 RepID=A0A427AZA9_ENSVE|nr:hypothetical protein B296_00007231 [Ensete ventricosum]